MPSLPSAVGYDVFVAHGPAGTLAVRCLRKCLGWSHSCVPAGGAVPDPWSILLTSDQSLCLVCFFVFGDCDVSLSVCVNMTCQDDPQNQLCSQGSTRPPSALEGGPLGQRLCGPPPRQRTSVGPAEAPLPKGPVEQSCPRDTPEPLSAS